MMQRPDAESALQQLVIGTVPAGSECAFAKMTTFLDPYSAAWVLLKGHRVVYVYTYVRATGSSMCTCVRATGS